MVFIGKKPIVGSARSRTAFLEWNCRTTAGQQCISVAIHGLSNLVERVAAVAVTWHTRYWIPAVRIQEVQGDVRAASRRVFIFGSIEQLVLGDRYYWTKPGRDFRAAQSIRHNRWPPPPVQLIDFP